MTLRHFNQVFLHSLPFTIKMKVYNWQLIYTIFYYFLNPGYTQSLYLVEFFTGGVKRPKVRWGHAQRCSWLQSLSPSHFCPASKMNAPCNVKLVTRCSYWLCRFSLVFTSYFQKLLIIYVHENNVLHDVLHFKLRL